MMGLDWHNQILLTKLKQMFFDVIVLFYMSSKFIVDILGCNFIVTDLILH